MDLRGVTPGMPPTAQNFLNFMWFCGKIWQNHRLAPPHGGLAPPPGGLAPPPGGLVPPPMGNPGSVPGEVRFIPKLAMLSLAVAL